METIKACLGIAIMLTDKTIPTWQHVHNITHFEGRILNIIL